MAGLLIFYVDYFLYPRAKGFRQKAANICYKVKERRQCNDFKYIGLEVTHH